MDVNKVTMHPKPAPILELSDVNVGDSPVIVDDIFNDSPLLVDVSPANANSPMLNLANQDDKDANVVETEVIKVKQEDDNTDEVIEDGKQAEEVVIKPFGIKLTDVDREEMVPEDSVPDNLNYQTDDGFNDIENWIGNSSDSDDNDANVIRAIDFPWAINEISLPGIKNRLLEEGLPLKANSVLELPLNSYHKDSCIAILNGKENSYNKIAVPDIEWISGEIDNVETLYATTATDNGIGALPTFEYQITVNIDSDGKTGTFNYNQDDKGYIQDTEWLIDTEELTNLVTQGDEPTGRQARMAGNHATKYRNTEYANDDIYYSCPQEVADVTNDTAKQADVAVGRPIVSFPDMLPLEDKVANPWAISEAILQVAGYEWLDSVIKFFTSELRSVYGTRGIFKKDKHKVSIIMMVAWTLHMVKLDRLVLTMLNAICVMIKIVNIFIHIILLKLNSINRMIPEKLAKDLLPFEWAIPLAKGLDNRSAIRKLNDVIFMMSAGNYKAALPKAINVATELDLTAIMIILVNIYHALSMMEDRVKIVNCLVLEVCYHNWGDKANKAIRVLLPYWPNPFDIPDISLDNIATFAAKLPVFGNMSLSAAIQVAERLMHWGFDSSAIRPPQGPQAKYGWLTAIQSLKSQISMVPFKEYGKNFDIEAIFAKISLLPAIRARPDNLVHSHEFLLSTIAKCYPLPPDTIANYLHGFRVNMLPITRRYLDIFSLKKYIWLAEVRRLVEGNPINRVNHDKFVAN